MIGQPFHDLGKFVRGIIVGNGKDDFAGGNSGSHSVEEPGELLVGMLPRIFLGVLNAVAARARKNEVIVSLQSLPLDRCDSRGRIN